MCVKKGRYLNELQGNLVRILGVLHFLGLHCFKNKTIRLLKVTQLEFGIPLTFQVLISVKRLL